MSETWLALCLPFLSLFFFSAGTEQCLSSALPQNSPTHTLLYASTPASQPASQPWALSVSPFWYTARIFFFSFLLLSLTLLALFIDSATRSDRHGIKHQTTSATLPCRLQISSGGPRPGQPSILTLRRLQHPTMEPTRLLLLLHPHPPNPAYRL